MLLSWDVGLVLGYFFNDLKGKSLTHYLYSMFQSLSLKLIFSQPLSQDWAMIEIHIHVKAISSNFAANLFVIVWQPKSKLKASLYDYFARNQSTKNVCRWLCKWIYLHKEMDLSLTSKSVPQDKPFKFFERITNKIWQPCTESKWQLRLIWSNFIALQKVFIVLLLEFLIFSQKTIF